MKLLRQDIRNAVIKEMTRANKKHGITHASHHEAYAVILKEVEDARDESNGFKFFFEKYWGLVKQDESSDVLNELLRDMKCAAEKTAAEWIQIAAMCGKAVKEKSQCD